MNRILCTAVLALLCLAAPAVASEPHLVLVRVESLDALLADVDRFAGLAGREMTREELTAPLAGALGGGELDWIDAGKPWVVVATPAALEQRPDAFLLAVPVTSEAAAVAALAALMPDPEPDDDGVRTLMTPLGMPAAAAFRDGYLLASADRGLALGADLDALTARRDLPPGSVAVDLLVERIAPLALAGLDTARGRLEQGLLAGEEEPAAESGADEEPEAEDEEPVAAPPPAEAEPEAEAEPGVDGPQAPELDSAAVSAMLDLYLDVARNLLLNTSRMQISVELGGGHLVLHNRVVPLAGSTLEELLAAQEGGLPAVARLVEPSATSFAVVAGQVTLTPRVVTALKGWTSRYADVMDSLFAGLGGEPEMAEMGSWFRTLLGDAERWPDCYRGDFAGSYGFGAGSGMHGVQVMGARDAELCQALLDQWLEASSSVPVGEDAAPLATVEPDALVYKGVRATRFSVDPELFTEGVEEDPLGLLGAEALVSYTGLKDDLVLTTSGAGAEAAFRRLVDRSADPAAAGGLDGGHFSPLPAGPGVMASLDLGAFAAAAGETDEAAAAVLERLGSGRVVYGVHLAPGAMHSRFVLPLEWLAGIRELATEAAPEEPVEPEVTGR